MFATSYIKQETDGGKHKNKWKSQSLKTICVGTCPDTDGLIFYHPSTKTLLSCADKYRSDTYHPAGPQFNEPFDGRMKLNTKSSLENIHTAPSHETRASVFVKTNDEKYHKATVLSTPFNEDDEHYVVQLQQSGDILQLMGDEIYESDPNEVIPADTVLNHMLPWLKTDSKITILLPMYNRPKQGHLQHSTADGEWYFIPRRNKNNTPFHLSHFQEKAFSMYQNKKLFNGWVNTR